MRCKQFKWKKHENNLKIAQKFVRDKSVTIRERSRTGDNDDDEFMKRKEEGFGSGFTGAKCVIKCSQEARSVCNRTQSGSDCNQHDNHPERVI